VVGLVISSNHHRFRLAVSVGWPRSIVSKPQRHAADEASDKNSSEKFNSFAKRWWQGWRKQKSERSFHHTFCA
jgi:hypothetical protein